MTYLINIATEAVKNSNNVSTGMAMEIFKLKFDLFYTKGTHQRSIVILGAEYNLRKQFGETWANIFMSTILSK